MNRRNGFCLKSIWFENEEEFLKMKDHIINGEKNELFDLLFKLQERGDL